MWLWPKFSQLEFFYVQNVMPSILNNEMNLSATKLWFLTYISCNHAPVVTRHLTEV